MLDLANIQGDDRVLEPSAGMGDVQPETEMLLDEVLWPSCYQQDWPGPSQSVDRMSSVKRANQNSRRL